MKTREGIGNGYDPLDLEAVDWVVRLSVGHLSDADREAFDYWHSASSEHKQAFATAQDLCRHLRRIPLPIDADSFADADAAEAAHGDNVVPFAPPAPHPRLSRRAFLGGGGAIAASLAGGLMMTNPPFDFWPSLAELMADERTGAGERHAFSPIAGVAVELNSRTSASQEGGGNGLHLIGGEAFVSVANRDQPFRVRADGATIIAEHASFNVQALGDRLCITCVRGSVTVERAERSDILRAGREIQFASDGRVREATADEFVRLAWRRGLLILRRTPVVEAIPQINRYFPGRLVLTDNTKSEWPVTGVFHIDQIELAVVQLQRLLDVKATRLPGGVVLLG